MSYSRTIFHPELAAGDDLMRAMAGLGMAFAVEPEGEANIEDTLIAASVMGMEQDDLRVLGMLVAWLDIHHPRLNVDRITRVVPLLSWERSRCFWVAVAERLVNDRRWRRLSKFPKSKGRLDLLRTGTEFHIQRRGEDSRFAGTHLRVPEGTLRRRTGDVLTPQALARIHMGYRHRVLIGASYRADAWAALALNAELSPAALARLTYTSFATAWQVKQDFHIVVS